MFVTRCFSWSLSTVGAQTMNRADIIEITITKHGSVSWTREIAFRAQISESPLACQLVGDPGGGTCSPQVVWWSTETQLRGSVISEVPKLRTVQTRNPKRRRWAASVSSRRWRHSRRAAADVDAARSSRRCWNFRPATPCNRTSCPAGTLRPLSRRRPRSCPPVTKKAFQVSRFFSRL